MSNQNTPINLHEQSALEAVRDLARRTGERAEIEARAKAEKADPDGDEDEDIDAADDAPVDPIAFCTWAKKAQFNLNEMTPEQLHLAMNFYKCIQKQNVQAAATESVEAMRFDDAAACAALECSQAELDLLCEAQLPGEDDVFCDPDGKIGIEDMRYLAQKRERRRTAGRSSLR